MPSRDTGSENAGQMSAGILGDLARAPRTDAERTSNALLRGDMLDDVALAARVHRRRRRGHAMSWPFVPRRDADVVAFATARRGRQELGVRRSLETERLGFLPRSTGHRRRGRGVDATAVSPTRTPYQSALRDNMSAQIPITAWAAHHGFGGAALAKLEANAGVENGSRRSDGVASTPPPHARRRPRRLRPPPRSPAAASTPPHARRPPRTRSVIYSRRSRRTSWRS